MVKCGPMLKIIMADIHFVNTFVNFPDIDMNFIDCAAEILDLETKTSRPLGLENHAGLDVHFAIANCSEKSYCVPTANRKPTITDYRSPITDYPDSTRQAMIKRQRKLRAVHI